MESEIINYPNLMVDVVLFGEVKCSLVDVRSGELLASWVEREEEEDLVKYDPFSVYTCKLDSDIYPEELSSHFCNCGHISRITMLRNRVTGQYNGSAYIQYTTMLAATRALGLDGSTLRGRNIYVKRKLISDTEKEKSDKVKKKSAMEKKKSAMVKKKRAMEKKCVLESCSVFVSNLDQRVTSLDLATHFHSVGEISNVTVDKDPDTGQHEGTGCIQFKDNAKVESALRLEGSMLMGKLVRVGRKRRHSSVDFDIKDEASSKF